MITDVDKKLFSQRLRQAMADKRVSQSDVARHLFGHHVDNRGRDVASDRSMVSKWCLGKSIPITTNLHPLAKYLGVEPEWLAPGHGRVPTARDTPPEFQVSQRGNVFLVEINKTMPAEMALKIMAIMQEEKTRK